MRNLWDEKAEIYHERFVREKAGPFRSVDQLIATANLKSGDKVLDVGTGTGMVAFEAAKAIGKEGQVIGIDISTGQLSVAKRNACTTSNLQFLEMDAESLSFDDGYFDAVLSQFALMCFPDFQKSLREMKRVLVRGGTIAMSVHGTSDNVPYYSVIMDSLLKHVPEIIPVERPSPTRFGNYSILKSELEKVGFDNIQLTSYTYPYTVESFDKYWHDYMESLGESLRTKIMSLDTKLYDTITNESYMKSRKFLKDGNIVFPWQVIIISAKSE